MDDDAYVRNLAKLCNEYQAGEITPDEFRERMVIIREAKHEQAQMDKNKTIRIGQ